MSTFSGSEAMSPQEQAHHLREMMRGFCMTQMLYVAAKLGLADLLSDGPKSTDELATATDANADALYRVLRALASFGIFEEATERRFGLTPMATLLQEKHPYSVRPHALFHGEDAYRSWSDLLYTVRSGEHRRRCRRWARNVDFSRAPGESRVAWHPLR